jgi:hypothetical protein
VILQACHARVRSSAHDAASRRCRQASARGLGLLGLALWLGLGLVAPPAHPSDGLEQRLKVTYLYNFTRFVDWPDASVGDAFVIAVIGDPEMASALRALERPGKRAEGKPIRIRRVDSAAELADAQVLFIGAAAVPGLASILARTEGAPILLVGDTPGLARRGVALNFFLQPDILGDGAQLRFEISASALQERPLGVLSDLFEVGKVLP